MSKNQYQERLSFQALFHAPPWRLETDEGKPYGICELDEHILYVESEPNDLYSFSVTDKEGEVIRTVFDFDDAASAKEAAESQWQSCLKPTPRLSRKGESLKWRIVEAGWGSECRILGNSALLQTWRDENSGLWSYSAYYQNMLLVEEAEECDTNSEAQDALKEWYQENALDLLQVHAMQSK